MRVGEGTEAEIVMRGQIKKPIYLGLFLLVSLLFLGLTGPARADSGGDSKTVGNVVIYLGLLPAEMIRGHPAQHPETSMHGGRPAGTYEYHVIVALFDARSGARITKADVSARVSEIGLAGEQKRLEPMEIAGALTYGNFFRMAGNGPFEITLRVSRPGTMRPIEVRFEHRH